MTQPRPVESWTCPRCGQSVNGERVLVSSGPNETDMTGWHPLCRFAQDIEDRDRPPA